MPPSIGIIPIFWPTDVKNRLIGKDPEAGNDIRREEKVSEQMDDGKQ